MLHFLPSFYSNIKYWSKCFLSSPIVSSLAPFLSSSFLIILIVYMCVYMYVHMCPSACRANDGIRSLGDLTDWHLWTTNVDDGNHTELCKISKCLFLLFENFTHACNVFWPNLPPYSFPFCFFPFPSLWGISPASSFPLCSLFILFFLFPFV